jgi:carbon-monoxide dehydrogenase medium subunit
MKPPPFEYYAASSIDDAIAALSRFGEDARVLAGGQSLVPLMNFRMARPSGLVDLNRCAELDYLLCEGDELVCGSMTRQTVAERSSVIAETCPLIMQALVFAGSPAIRNRGTVGGVMAHGDRVAELPGVAVALGARFVVRGPSGDRTIDADAFFLGDLTTAIEPGEILREIRFPRIAASARTAFVEAGNRALDLALCGIACVLERAADGEIAHLRMVAIGIAERPIRLVIAEAALMGHQFDTPRLREAVYADIEHIDIVDDLHATAAHRRRLLPALAHEAIRRAAESA